MSNSWSNLNIRFLVFHEFLFQLFWLSTCLLNPNVTDSYFLNLNIHYISLFFYSLFLLSSYFSILLSVFGVVTFSYSEIYFVLHVLDILHPPLYYKIILIFFLPVETFEYSATPSGYVQLNFFFFKNFKF